MDNAMCAFCLMVTMHQTACEPLVEKLGDKNYKVREKYQRILSEQLNVPWQEFMARNLVGSRQDLETCTRLRILTKNLCTLTTEYGKYPWIDALPYSFPKREEIIASYLKKSEFVQGEDFFKWRFATKLFLEDLQQQGWWNSSLQQLQRQMLPMELYWIKYQKYPPP